MNINLLPDANIAVSLLEKNNNDIHSNQNRRQIYMRLE